MKLKNTLGVAIASVLAATSLTAMAQGQGAVEVEAFAKYYEPDSSRNLTDGALYGASLGYFLTEDVSLALSYGEYNDIKGDNLVNGRDKVKGSLTSLDAIYHFRNSEDALRPYISTGFAHQSIGQAARGGRDHSTYANFGTGLKYYFTENFFAKAAVDGMYNIDNNEGEWMAGLGVGLNFGGSAKAAPAPAPVAQPEPVVEVIEEEVVAEVVRVELDVKFDFDKSRVKEESYADIQSVAEFMNQYPQTTTTVEGYTDSIGTDAYNLKLSERRANAVRDVLVNQYGVAGNRVGSVGYGESNPIASNDTEEGRALNRRVEAAVEAQVK